MLRNRRHIKKVYFANEDLAKFICSCAYAMDNKGLIPTKLTCNGTITCKESVKSANCEAVTMAQGEKAYMRMKPDWLNDSSVAYDVTTTESSYIRCIGVPAQCSCDAQAHNGLRHDRNKRIKERKSHPTICRANSYYKTKRRLVAEPLPISVGLRGRVTALSSQRSVANGASIVVRAWESHVHGEGKQVNRQVLTIEYV